MSLNQEMVKRVATLARLNLPGERIEHMQQDLNRILHFIDQLNEVNISESVDNRHASSMLLRKDGVTDGNCIEKILENAPEVMCHMFVVPKVVE